MKKNILNLKEDLKTLRALPVILISLFVIHFNVSGQNIDATIGINGRFMVKSATDTFMTVTQTTRNIYVNHGITLPPVTDNSTDGTIYKGANRFIHTYEIPSTDGQNTFIGVNSGNFSMTRTSAFDASYNTAVGSNTLTSLTTGYQNSAFGYVALYYNNSGYGNSAFGMHALHSNTSGIKNSAFGQQSLTLNTIGEQNSAFGWGALNGNTTAGNNSAFGFYALLLNDTGSYNSSFGAFSLQRNVIGSHNSALGYMALYSSLGDDNTALGYYAGTTLTTGSNVTCIGYYALPSAVDASNEITLGNNSVTVLRCHTTTITALSDVRDKKNIRDLNLGIDFLMKVKPRLFNWDRRDWYENRISDGSKTEKTLTAGFIAQELDEVQTAEQAEWLKLVLKNNPDRLEATPGNLLPIIVRAIQDIKKEKDEQIAFLTNKLTQYEEMQKILISKIEIMESTDSRIKEVNMGENK